jgi:hypothetical protein
LIGKGLLLELIVMANWKESKAVIGGNVVAIERGQILTSARELVDRTKLSRSSLERWLKILEKLGTISQKMDSKCRVITIHNYSEYQDPQTYTRTTDGQQTDNNEDNKRTTDGHILKHLNIKAFKESKKGNSADACTPVDNFLNAYSSCIEKVYSKKPRITSKLRAIASEIIAEVGEERSVALATAFCASGRDYYVKRAHALSVMLEDLSTIDMFV